jgi:hypothetical protein
VTKLGTSHHAPRRGKDAPPHGRRSPTGPRGCDSKHAPLPCGPCGRVGHDIGLADRGAADHRISNRLIQRPLDSMRPIRCMMRCQSAHHISIPISIPRQRSSDLFLAGRGRSPSYRPKRRNRPTGSRVLRDRTPANDEEERGYEACRVVDRCCWNGVPWRGWLCALSVLGDPVRALW